MVIVMALGQPWRKRGRNSADNGFFPWAGTDGNFPDNSSHHQHHHDGGGGHHGHFDGGGHFGGGDCGGGHAGH